MCEVDSYYLIIITFVDLWAKPGFFGICGMSKAKTISVSLFLEFVGCNFSCFLCIWMCVCVSFELIYLGLVWWSLAFEFVFVSRSGFIYLNFVWFGIWTWLLLNQIWCVSDLYASIIGFYFWRRVRFCVHFCALESFRMRIRWFVID